MSQIRSPSPVRSPDSRASGSPSRRRSSARGEGVQLVREPYELWTWGFGGHGALGNQAFRDELLPFLVSSLRAHGGTLLVACGHDHTVAVTGDLKARGWGRAQEGQLGVGAAEQLESPRGVSSVVAPALMSVCRGETAVSVQAIAAGGLHTMLITQPRSSAERRVVYAMGRSTDGQLGAGKEVLERETGGEAQLVAMPSATAVPSLVGCGGLHSALVSEHGGLYTWGSTSLGQTGHPTTLPCPRPVLLNSETWEGRMEKEGSRVIQVSAADEGGKTFHVRCKRGAPLQVSCVSCGAYHTAACTVEGELFAWGANGSGQLGLGDRRDRPFPHQVRGFDGPGTMLLQVACGGKHTLALTQKSEAWSWGSNEHRQLGRRDAHGDGGLRPRVVELPSDCRVVLIAAGGAHSAVVAADGAVVTWGKNQNGQLGLGHAHPTERPAPVKALPPRAIWVACGGAHTAALVRLPASSSAGGVTDRRASMGGGSPEAGRRSSAADWRTSLERRSSTGATIASMP